MSIRKRIIIQLVTLSALVMPVLAATDKREPPGLIAVWIFLGFCALIIVAQLLPLVKEVVHKWSEAKVRRVEAGQQRRKTEQASQ